MNTDDSKLRSYPKIWNIGHANLNNLFLGEVVVQEKVDGSQFSFGVENGKLKFRSKRSEKFLGSNDQLFELAMETIHDIFLEGKLQEGWIYRGEAITSPKHNVLTYDRIPKGGFVLFDVDLGLEKREPDPERLKNEGEYLGLEVVPTLYQGEIHSPEELKETFLGKESFLGGPDIEGIVIKNYEQFGSDGKMLMGKVVSEDFREKHGTDWKNKQPSRKDVIEQIIDELRTEARWMKSVQHRREDGLLENAPRDIGPLIKEIQNDVKEEEEEYIKQVLFNHFWKKISRGIIRGMPEWYKGKLLEHQNFGEEE